MTGARSSGPPQEWEGPQGFSLDEVIWGYRDIFRTAIGEFFEANLIGPGRESSTREFFAFLSGARRTGFDAVVKEFLVSLHPNTRQLLVLPDVFSGLIRLGREFGEAKLPHGTTFFRIWGEGGFGNSPAEVRNLLAHLRRLHTVDENLAIAFLKGYRHLVERLAPVEMEEYIECGLRVFRSNRASGLRFMEGLLRSSEETLRVLSRECRLTEVRPALKTLLRALSGCEVEVGDLGYLDSDVLLERGTNMVCMARRLCLPRRCRRFESAAQNRNWYLLAGIAAAGTLSYRSFPCIHGHSDCTSCADLVGEECLNQNLFVLLEYLRVLQNIREHWPGARGLLAFGLRAEREDRPAATPPEQLFFDAIAPEGPATRGAELVGRVADESADLFDTAARLNEDWVGRILVDYPGLDRFPLRPFSFLPDFLYPGQAAKAPSESLVADLRTRSGPPRREAASSRDTENSGPIGLPEGAGDKADTEKKNGEREKGSRIVPACYVYDEWSQRERDYYRHYCLVYEREPGGTPSPLPDDVACQANRMKRLFELLRPDVTRREKRLADGEVINHERLVDYLVNRQCGPSPRIDFYEKPRSRERDLAVLILLDVSGSTQHRESERAVIEIEKHAAFVLGHALAALGDRFAVCGFSSQGRKNCEYFIYKGFDDEWNAKRGDHVLAATSLHSTRMGPALRHSGYRLAQLEARTRLLILITDGKPMDSDYDPNTRYAQHDVRKACEENRRLGIHTFCVSTDKDTRADLEIMFPQNRFAILSNVGRLSEILPSLYARLTK